MQKNSVDMNPLLAGDKLWIEVEVQDFLPAWRPEEALGGGGVSNQFFQPKLFLVLRE